ncbi:ATP-binding protein [Alicycliphilus denitrificans]|uniref:ATP-binding protein n=1 Tax=Alicycliphilus denitrificans TaxID=179636 RepID=UPI003850BCED
MNAALLPQPPADAIGLDAPDATAAAPAALDWGAANQQLLGAEFQRLGGLLEGRPTEAGTADSARLRDALRIRAAIDVLCDAFDLSHFERDLLLLAAGADMDAQVASACARAQPDRPWPSFGLALARLPDAHWSALAPVGPLRRWQLLQPLGDDNILQARLRADERILHYLAGVNHLDARLQALLRPVSPHPLAPSHAADAAHIAQTLRAGPAPPPIAVLLGEAPEDLADIAGNVASALGYRLYRLHAADLPQDGATLQWLATLWQRDAALMQAALLVQMDEDTVAGARFVARIGGLVFLAARQPPSTERAQLRFNIAMPAAAERLALWRQALPAIADNQHCRLAAAAYQFRMSAASIREAADGLAPALARGDADVEQVWEHCRKQLRNGLQGLAERIETRSGWSDLVLPAAQMATLRQIVAHVRHREQVHQSWGFGPPGTRGLGIATLFCGESGTGKTMAAEVLAHALRLDLYRVDLSAVVSKYIGETEKNLRRVFDAAEGSGAVLLFDEADALFGRRSEVKDSHDRYANVEVSYLLQRMESYQGLAILTSNFKAALDPAFLRRLRFVVNFAFPDLAEREALWRKVFPATAPTDTLDFAALARLQVAGGSIRNIALHAAFHAAEAGCAIGMAHLLGAAQQEMARHDRSFTPLALRGLP